MDLVEKWKEVFSFLGSGERISIMIVLHGSKYLRHTHYGSVDEGCLTFSQILESTGIESDTRLSYHLSKLIGAGLVKKFPFKDKKGRVFPMYTIGEKWRSFASELAIDKLIKDYIKEKYPDSFVEET
ncbi:hypothetical protein DRO69_06570 [Candidatus Bathyarchaeota archaeon]|nr:MAG: hypothetical protein DRO69_06570 [Candidatus Bathyarchaeota archaeon]